MVHIYNGILLNHKKEWIWVGSSKVNEHRTCYTEWSKSEREKQISYINAHTWNLEKWYRSAYIQGKNRDTDVENWPVNAGEKERVGWTERAALTYIHYHLWCRLLVGSCCATQGARPGALWRFRGVESGEGGSRGRGYM